MAPAIRNFGPQDLEAYVALVNRAYKTYGWGQPSSETRAREGFGHPHNYPERDLFLAEVEEMVAGYAHITPELEIGRAVLEGTVHPDYLGRGVATRLLEVALNHARNLGATRVHIPLPSRTSAPQNFLLKRGFIPVRSYWVLEREVEPQTPIPQPPRGFSLRPFSPGDEADLSRLHNQAFAQHWGFRPNTMAEISYEVKMSFCCPQGILLVTQGRRMVGYCWTREDEDRAEIWRIGVEPQYRRHGLGRLALLAGLAYLAQRGVKVAELTVDQDNSTALNLYRSLGFRKKEEILFYEKEIQ